MAVAPNPEPPQQPLQAFGVLEGTNPAFYTVLRPTGHVVAQGHRWTLFESTQFSSAVGKHCSCLLCWAPLERRRVSPLEESGAPANVPAGAVGGGQTTRKGLRDRPRLPGRPTCFDFPFSAHLAFLSSETFQYACWEGRGSGSVRSLPPWAPGVGVPPCRESDTWACRAGRGRRGQGQAVPRAASGRH